MRGSLPLVALAKLARNIPAGVNAFRSGVDMGLQSSDVATDPVMLQIEITSRCNFTCGYCIVHNGTETEQSSRDMAPELFAEILSTFPSAFYLQLHGQGESLLHPQLTEFLRLTRAQRRLTSLVTNGSLWTEQKTCEIMEAGVDIVAFSLDICAHERMRRMRSGMEPQRIEENLARVLRLRDSVAPDTVVGVSAVVLASAPDEERAEALARLDAIGVDFVMRNDLASTVSYRDRYPEDVRAEAGGVLSMLGGMHRYAMHSAPSANVILGRCIWPWAAMYINADGQVSYCSNNHRICVGDFRMPNVRNLVRHVEARRAFGAGQVPEACVGCGYLRRTV